jgi:fibronectin type 3 domain-containing protein
MRRTPVLALAVCLAASGLTGLATRPTPAYAAPPTTANALNAAFASYGNTSGRWAGGDGTVSVELPDGRIAWLLSDSFVGAVNADHSLPAATTMVNNAIVVQSGTGLTTTLTGGTPSAPTALVDPGVAGEFYWVGDAIVEGANLRAIYNRYRKTGTGSLDFAFVGSALATFALPSLSLTGVTALPYGSTVAWGASLLTAGGHTYVYGTELNAAGGMKFGHVARVPSGNLAAAWQFWTGSTWSADHTASARLLSGVAANFGIELIGGQYVLVTSESNVPFNAQLVAYTAPAPTGPFSGPIDLLTAPEPAADDKPIIVYNAQLHQEQAPAGKLLVSYDVNSLRIEDVTADVRNYRPRFVEVDWPRPAPGAGVPAAPTGLTATADSSGTVRLTWSAPSGPTFTVYQRDVTSGQTHFVRVAPGVTANFADIGFLNTGRTYEFRVTATNTAGESAPSVSASAAVVIAPPAAPTGVTAVADTAGAIAVSWSAIPHAWGYDVYRRDVTAGEAEATQVSGGVQATSHTVTGGQHQHVYEFTVVARHGGGASPPSAPVSATAFYALPGAPTGLTATPGADGTIALSWTTPGPDVWFMVYQRDVTAGEPGFTQLPLPITECCAMTAGFLQHGHLYEFAVAATNPGGEGPKSTVVSATPAFPAPQAPAGLTAEPGNGKVTLTWTEGTTSSWYWIHLRDLTDGETGFTKLELPVTECCTFTAEYLENAHTYEFAVSTVGASGGPDSVLSNVVSVAPIALPPTGLTAVAGNGEATLTWTETQPGSWYWVYQRDVTAGEDFRRLEYPISTCCAFTAGFLANGHTYEWRLASAGFDGGQDSVLSNLATALPQADAPGAPSGLTASSGNGKVTLSWTASSTPGAWYWIYQRDVTAGEAFRKLEHPLSTCCTFTGDLLVNGHVYEYKVTTVGSGGPDSAASNTVSVTPLALPPTGLTAVAGNGEATLTWTETQPGSWYWVYQRDVTAGEAFRRLEYPLSTCCSFRAGLLTNGHVYEWRFTTVGANGGADSAVSNTATATPLNAPPGAPSNLRAASGNGKATLTWTASSTPGAWYWIYQRDVTAGEAFRKLEYPLSTCCAFTADALVNGHAYEWKVTTVGNGGPDSEPSNTASATPRALPPTGLTAVAGNGQATLTWTETQPGSWYWVYQRDVTAGETTFTMLQYPVSTCCSFTPGLLVNGHRYEWKLATDGAHGGADSGFSNTATATPVAPPPGPPSNLRVTAGDGKATLTWNASSTPGAWYWVYQRDVTTGEGFRRLELPISSCCTFTAGYLANGHTYEFRITTAGANGGPDSGPSNTVSVRPMPPLPAAPTGLSATTGNKTVTLRWTASSTPNVYYWVYQRDVTAGTGWQKLPLPLTSCCTFNGGYLINGHTYEWKIAAANLTGVSGFSNTVSGRPMPPFPQAPSNLKATVGNGTVQLKWTKSATAEVYYWIYQRDVTAGSGWQRLPYPVTSCCTFNGGLLINGHTYEWKITAANLSGVSGYSNTVSGKPMPPFPQAPTWVVASPGPGSSVALTWSASATPNVNYIIWYREAGLKIWYRYMIAPMSTSYTIGINSYRGELYEFKISAFNISGESGTTSVTKGMARDVNRTSTSQLNWNNGSNALAAGRAAGKFCENRGFQRVCYNSSSNLEGQPMTVGDYLLYGDSQSDLTRALECEAYKRANIRYNETYNRGRADTTATNYANSSGPDLFRHEEVHSWQWMGFSNWSHYAAAYAFASYISWRRYGNAWQGNDFEIGAGLHNGSYIRIYAPRHYTGEAGNCSWHY